MISIRNLRKEFLLSHSGAGSLKAALLWWRPRRIERLTALSDVSIEISKGESVALIGRNGAGKSTLLSLLARIYKPTSGSVHVGGRMAPLLELGAGFHPDLTGYENVIFNGVILGLTREEVRSRVQQIVDFAELSNHIDAPVRSYSSGMLARLGFAIAVHVDADILIVDEVLAVGDYAFEKKCYSFLNQFKAGGGTVLFVSHNMDSVRRVADRCIWLKSGELKADGKVEDIITMYEADPEASTTL